MAPTSIIVVAELALEPTDVDQIVGLYGPGTRVQVLVPVGHPDESRLRAAMDHLVLGELEEAWLSLKGHDPDANSAAGAATILRESLAELRAAGTEADGECISGDLIAALVQAVNSVKAQAEIFVTRPHLVDDTLHAAWSAKARRTMGIPVIHFYGGTTKLLT
jgi:hypothetical protein